MPQTEARTAAADHAPADQGLLFVVSAPSGAGKTSLVKALLEVEPSLHLSVSYTTRPPREGEQDGVHYHFVDAATFERMVQAGEFVEYARVFGNAYGTAAKTLRAGLDAGADLLLEIDWQGARQVRGRFSEAISVFIAPPSLQALEERLRGRGKDSDDIIAARMAQARDELSHHGEYDYLVVNDDFGVALDELRAIVAAERLRESRQARRHAAVLDAMLAAD
ncbi:MAG: guanylate kinase [Thiohalocapsa sp.]|jgi:guanylate kinase|uniref:guanylate kinase n=1 Tax=Thiohalocapsa sp. TaxID=2497641 RepID=UPI0025F8F57A|nr:guanylate kinase [Thiohalocapsa sp.]MCG6941906.1 guanylate kinase [Thiohalocapsa sp.]